MKKTGICPKCGSDRVVNVNEIEQLRFAVGLLRLTRPQGLICCGCGNMELWLPEEDLDKIYNEYQWNKVNVPGK